ncbi:MAG: hypothetical protein IT262_03120 [Saprospiraceae bacterium]|nr:hypothetical protein [Saprospiraceae bacterium]
MDTPMLQKLREYLATTSREQVNLDWAEVKALGLKGPSAKEFIASFQQPLTFQHSDSEAFQTESAQVHLTFDVENGNYLYAMAA